jgi:hypothetical protein
MRTSRDRRLLPLLAGLGLGCVVMVQPERANATPVVANAPEPGDPITSQPPPPAFDPPPSQSLPAAVEPPTTQAQLADGPPPPQPEDPVDFEDPSAAGLEAPTWDRPPASEPPQAQPPAPAYEPPKEAPSGAMTDEAWHRSRRRLGIGLGVSLGGVALGTALIPTSIVLACGDLFCDPFTFWVGAGFGISMIVAGTVGTVITSVRLHRLRQQRPAQATFSSSRKIAWSVAGTGLQLRF